MGFRGRTDGLTGLRQVFVFLLSALWLLLVLLYYIFVDRDAAEALPAGWSAAGLALYGVVALLLTRWARSRPLDAESATALAGSYRNNFFKGIAFSESVALAAFVSVFLSNRLWIYLIGLAFSMIGFAMIVPTRGNIERKQQEIMAQGSPLSLGDALMHAPPPDHPYRGPVVSWPQ
jgi:hypothetical protein